MKAQLGLGFHRRQKGRLTEAVFQNPYFLYFPAPGSVNLASQKNLGAKNIISFWARISPSRIATTDNIGTVLGCETAGEGIRFTIDSNPVTADYVSMAVHNASNPLLIDYFIWSFSGDGKIDSYWHHWTFVRDGAWCDLYLDGVKISRQTIVNTAYVFFVSRIGRESSGDPSVDFKGYLDCVAYWAFATLPATEQYEAAITAMYNSGTPGDPRLHFPTFAKGLYVFDEGDGTTTEDDSLEENDGTFATMTRTSWREYANWKQWYLEFNGSNNSISLSTALHLDDNHAASIIMWVYNDIAQVHDMLLGEAFDTNQFSRLDFDTDDLKLNNKFNANCQWNDSLTTGWKLIEILVSAGDSDNFSLYINQSSKGKRTIAVTTFDFLKIAQGGANNYYFSGYLDSLYIFNASLNATERNLIYGKGTPQTGGNPSSIASLVNSFRFAEGAGTTVTDSKGGITGTFSVAPPSWRQHD